MKLYTKAKCRNCGRIFIYGNPTDVFYSKDDVLKCHTEFNIKVSKVLHNCSQDDDEEDPRIIGIADVIGLLFREEA